MQHIQKSKGFTLVELVIAIPVILVVMGGVLGLLITLLNDFSAQRTKQNLNVGAQTALQQIESDVKLSSAFLTKVDTTMFTKEYYGPNNAANSASAWSFQGYPPTTTSAFRTLILLTYATTENPLADLRSPVYIDQMGCTGDQLYRNQVLQNTIIYFVKGGSLYRRVLTPSDSIPRCGGPSAAFQKQSCPVLPGSRQSSCQTDDTELLKDVSQFKVDYYTTSTSTSAINTYSTVPAAATILDSATAVSITIKHSQDNSPITNTAVLRVTRLN